MIRQMLIALLAGGLVAGCDRPAESGDPATVAANGDAIVADPALAGAVADRIAADPALAERANGDAVRPPPQPDPGAVPAPTIAAARSAPNGTLRHAPAATGDCARCRTMAGALTLGELARRQRGCATDVAYSAAWANRLPADLPLHDDARVIEAAGVDRGNCRLRVVNFVTATPVGQVVDWYYTRATNAHYTAELQGDGRQQVLGGTRGDAAYVVFVRPRGSGSDVDLMVNTGR